jgi:hypothetical protein
VPRAVMLHQELSEHGYGIAAPRRTIGFMPDKRCLGVAITHEEPAASVARDTTIRLIVF